METFTIVAILAVSALLVWLCPQVQFPKRPAPPASPKGGKNAEVDDNFGYKKAA